MRYLLLLFCFPVAVFAQVASDANYCAESQIRRQAESVCRSDLTGREFCLTDGSARSCAYTIVIQNGTEITYCMTCIDGNQTAGGTAGGPAGGYNYQDCGFYYGDWTGCDSPIIINAADGNYPLSGPDDPVHFDLNAEGNPE